MTPSSTYFPKSLQERAAWFDNFETQFAQIAVSLGFTLADVTVVSNDNAVFQFCASTTVELDAFVKAFRQYRKMVTEGSVGEPTSAYPPNPAGVPPFAVSTGIFERLDNLITRIRVSPNYTPEVGSLLGIIPVSTVRPGNPQPVLKVETLPGSVVGVKFVRGVSDGISLEMKIDNADTWSDAGRFYSSPAELVIPSNPQNLPRAVQFRARYVAGNTPVGQFSPVVATATQPSI